MDVPQPLTRPGQRIPRRPSETEDRHQQRRANAHIDRQLMAGPRTRADLRSGAHSGIRRAVDRAITRRVASGDLIALPTVAKRGALLVLAETEHRSAA